MSSSRRHAFFISVKKVSSKHRLKQIYLLQEKLNLQLTLLYHIDSRALNGVKKDSSAHASKKLNPEEQKDAAADNSGAKIQASGKNSKEKSGKKKDDDNGLKKPLSAYMLFNNFRRPVLRDEYPRK